MNEMTKWFQPQINEVAGACEAACIVAMMNLEGHTWFGVTAEKIIEIIAQHMSETIDTFLKQQVFQDPDSPLAQKSLNTYREYGQQIADALNTQDELRDRIRVLQTESEAFQTQVHELEGDLSDLHDETDRLQSHLDAAQEQIGDLEAELADVQSELEANDYD